MPRARTCSVSMTIGIRYLSTAKTREKTGLLCGFFLEVALAAFRLRNTFQCLFNVLSTAGPGLFSALLAGHLMAHVTTQFIACSSISNIPKMRTQFASVLTWIVPNYYEIVMPPSTAMLAPVIAELAGEAIHAIAEAISLGSRSRHIGCCCANTSTSSRP